MGVKEISVEAHSGLEPMRGSLTGTYQDCLDYLDWSINVFAGKGKMSAEQKGKVFAEAVRTLRERFNIRISTHYLKQFCEKQKHKNLHIAYMLNLADYKTEPKKTTFKGAIVNGMRCVVPKIFDMLVTKEEWCAKQKREEAFKERCIAEWEERDKLKLLEQVNQK